MTISCPTCKSKRSMVKDSRPTIGTIRRRRECYSCGGRFTTVEIVVDDNETAVGMAALVADKRIDRDKLLAIVADLNRMV
jgi:transcriptional regulator NrdR family protein